jgi:Na+-transporting methylmalonyl-CoA/oxaloacetate decarboxylase gamma subunit
MKTLRTALVFLVAIVLAAIVYAAISLVRNRADESRQPEAAYAHLEAYNNGQSVLE